ncbi:MAG: DNA-directed RNA polymerase subunit omega [Desulfobulbaceae bacterium]|nr:DNA-directed RNA polymerase subunit omega [Desulfobulbaceae bacterium]MCK5436848.1 DNA-directed RNA polymerase subunit omega [Desulfobulbaceae bacterium]MCK5544139.1 DNA-directed RNA polymerase subunit omega [Desulfobulbaceae bacterium]
MARITVEDCLDAMGAPNRFDLIHLATTRVKQHRKGQPILAKGKNKEIVMTLREIAAGEVTFNNIKEFDNPEPENTVETNETEATESSKQKAARNG